ncbi:MAG: hypothetical protein IJW46_02040, partial [Clostridia bacterium]|nr:hypothetical protein [Clostridia bacterium]
MKRTLLFILLALLLAATLFITACGDDEDTTAPTKESTTVTTTPSDPSTTTPTTEAVDPSAVKQLLSGDVSLAGSVVLSANTDGEYAQVLRALSDLQSDLKAVTGKAPAIEGTYSSTTAVLVGTIGQNQTIDSLIASGAIDVSTVKNRWEGFTMGVYTGIEGADKTIVIAGNDKRGTIYGIYTLSELIGVSPWYWWADVPTETNSSLTLSAESLTRSEAPDVKYRGIFLNDEENFTFWSEAFE